MFSNIPFRDQCIKTWLQERIVKAKPNDTATDQAFRIYRISTPINGEVTAYAQHISYDLGNVAALQWSDAQISAPLAMEKVFSPIPPQPTTSPVRPTIPRQRRSRWQSPRASGACLGGVAGSFPGFVGR